MDLYTFTVEDFIIHDTRSVHNDTLSLSYTAYVDGDMVASRLISLGDFDNGEYSTIDYVPSDVGPSLGPVVINDPAAKCAFIFQLVIMRNSTSDGVTWSGWDQVEEGIRPEGAAAADEPLDVAAGIFHERIYLTSRWESTEGSAYETGYLTVNFSADGDDWSGWRIPEADSVFQASNAAGLAAVGSHLYILAPQWVGGPDNPTPVWAH